VNVPFLDLSRNVRALRAELGAAAQRTLDEAQFVLGSAVAEFEGAWAAACGRAHAVAVASGTDALALSLRAAGIGAGDEVITAANTCVPTVAAIEAAGATPVLADVDEHTWTLDPERVAEAVGPRTRAVVPVHLYGRPAELPELELPVIDDAAQAHGVPLRGVASAYSFYPTKNLGALGDGGAIATDDEAVAEHARRLRMYGEGERYRSDERGVNSRLDTLQAAFLLVKLPHFQEWQERRRALAQRYLHALAETELGLPADHAQHAWHLFVVRVPDRRAFRTALAERGVQTAVHYARAIHEHPAYRQLAGDGGFPVAEALAREVVSLPLYPELTDEEAEAVVKTVVPAARQTVV
jgi:dTDP-3-amino-3,4,6-trideoxy-alpha-D-glucose transaminase